MTVNMLALEASYRADCAAAEHKGLPTIPRAVVLVMDDTGRKQYLCAYHAEQLVRTTVENPAEELKKLQESLQRARPKAYERTTEYLLGPRKRYKRRTNQGQESPYHTDAILGRPFRS